MATTTIPLKQWIAQAHNSNGAPTRTYLASSLRIAISLTEQISEAEELSNVGLSSGLHSLPPPFPVACIDWAGCVTVGLRPVQIDDEVSDLSDNNEEDLEELFDKIAADDTELLNAENLTARGAGITRAAVGNLKKAENIFSLLNVENAQIAISDNSTSIYNSTHIDTPKDKQQRIYSLGLLFYELFSGGELPPPELLVVSSSTGGLTAICEGSAQQDASGLTQHNVQVGPSVDFAQALNMANEMDLASHDSVTGSRNNKYGHQDGSVSNKRHNSMGSRHSISSGGTNHSQVLYNVSNEHLRMKGVPGPLCDLIWNMCDCINGDFMGEDAYGDVSDVTGDLQLMIDKPYVYLDGLDANKLALTGLELEWDAIDRDKEFASILSAYKHSMLGSSMAIITGVSGTGKSTIAKRFCNFVTRNGGIFLSEKFDQMNRVKPFSAVASAFNKYCDTLLTEGERERAMLVASKLRTALGADMYYLVKMIPNLDKILPANSINNPPRHDAVDAQQRIYFLFCKFVEVISSCSGGPLTLFLDDCQWAEPASISIIGHLLMTWRSTKNGNQFFFLGACRNDEMGGDHPFWKMKESVGSFGVETTIVNLDCIDKDSVVQLISNLVQLSPRLVRSLSEIIYHKTKGLPLFLARMLRSLNKEGLLQISLAKNRWTWDEAAIQGRELPDDVVEFFVHNIHSLPAGCQLALRTLSCFGASVEVELIQALETFLNMELVEPLDIVVDEGLVSKIDDMYSFAHDKIQETAYGMIDEPSRCLHHMNYGLSLMNLSSNPECSSFFFTAVTQLNLGGPPAVQDASQWPLIAGYNLIAGKKAMECSDFSAAYMYFDHGMMFLRKNHWKEHYDLSLELYTLAAECALSAKNVPSVAMLYDHVSKNSRTFEDTLNVSFVYASALAFSKISESVEKCIDILARLGVEIPDQCSREDALELITSTQTLFDDINDETILKYPVMSDFKQITAMKFLAMLCNTTQQCRPALQPICVIKMIHITISSGISGSSAIGFAYFGGIIAQLGDIRAGKRFAKMAKTLVERNPSATAGEVLFVTAEILNYIEPMQVINQYRIQGQQIAMTAGDINSACLHSLMYAAASIHINKLSVAKEDHVNASRFCEEHGHMTSLYYLKTSERLLLTLIGNEDEALSDDHLTNQVIANKNIYQMICLYTQKLFLAIIFNNNDDVESNATKFLEFRSMRPWMLLSGTAFQTFLLGLASFRIYRKRQKALWLDIGKNHEQKMATWAEQGSLWNFEHQSCLLHAERAYSEGNFDIAQASYDRSISLAHQHKFVHHEAIAYELAANFHIDVGSKAIAMRYYTGAHGKYLEWGAFQKCTELFAFIQETFGSVLSLAGANGSGGSFGLHNNGVKERHCMR